MITNADSVRLVQRAREEGDFLLVGLHTDEDVQDRRGSHLPIMDLHERSLSVLACRYINEVVIGKPASLGVIEISFWPEDLLKILSIVSPPPWVLLKSACGQ